jgi:mRNA interferase RelE/StbE
VSRAIAWRRRALDELRRIKRRDRVTATRITGALQRLADTGRGDVRKLEGGEGEYRLRVGTWRVLFVLEDDNQTIVVARVVPRRDAYRG